MRKIVYMCILAALVCSRCHGLEKLVIVGSGPAGLTAALFAAQAKLDPLIIEGDHHDGQTSSICKIENYPGFPEGISGEELTDRIYLQAQMFGARFHCSRVNRVDLSQYPYSLRLSNGEEIFAESLVIATGAAPRWLGLEGEEALIGHGISASAALDGDQFSGREVVVYGGGDAAMEQALILAEQAAHVTLVFQADQLTGAPYLQERLFAHPKIECRFNSELIQLIGVEEGHLTALIVRDRLTGKETRLPCHGLIVSNGRAPNTALFRDQLEMNEKGLIVTKPDSTQTSVRGVFAAGDIVQSAYRKLTTAIGSGCMSAIDAARFLSEP